MSYVAIGLGFVLALFGLALTLPTTQPPATERICPKVQNGERLAYSTHHSNGSLECTYVPNLTHGMAVRKRQG